MIRLSHSKSRVATISVLGILVATTFFHKSAAFSPGVLPQFQKSTLLMPRHPRRQSSATFLKVKKDAVWGDSLRPHTENNKLATLIFPVAIACTVALSSPAFGLDPNTFTNDYADPLHPQCKRHIQVNTDGKSFHFSGTSVDQPKDDPVLRGCSREEVKQFGLRKGSFDGIIFDDNKISAGDGIHEGFWEPAGSASTNLGYEDVDGIRWNDGNKWVVQQKSLPTQIGEFITFSYIGFSLLAGVFGVNKMYQKKKAEES